MNQLKKLFFGIALASMIIMLQGCPNPIAEMVKMAKEQQLEVDPNPLELHGDNVGFKLSAKLPVKMMKKGTKYTLEVSYVPGDIETGVDLKPIEEISADAVKVGAVSFDGDTYAESTDEPKSTKSFSFNYNDKLETGGLYIKGIATKIKNNKSKEFGPIRLKVADGRFVKGVATTVRLVKSPVDGVNPSTGKSPFAYGDHGYKGPKDETISVKLGFAKGSATVNPTMGNNKEAIEMVTALFKDTKIPPFDARGISSHSPEGRESVNTQLANDRAAALENQFKRILALLKYSKDTIPQYKFNFEKRVLGETLPEFNEIVDASSLSPEEKTEAKEILGRSGDFVENEKELQTKPYYNTLMNDVYPDMRYAKTEVTKAGPQKSLADMTAMIEKMKKGEVDVDKMTEQEFLYAAANTPDLEEREAILKLAAQKYQTWKVHNNLGAAYLDMAILKGDNSYADKAITQLDASMGKKETGDAAFNLAMAYSLKGDEAKMEEYLEKAVNLGGSDNTVDGLINGARAYLAIKAAGARDDGKYKEAEDFLSKSNTPSTNPNLFNKGLSQLLQGVNYDAAIASLNSAAQANPKDAHTHYVLAVAYARKGSESDMAAALKKAVSLDGDLKAKAVKDVEFDKYKGSNSFKDAIK